MDERNLNYHIDVFQVLTISERTIMFLMTFPSCKNSSCYLGKGENSEASDYFIIFFCLYSNLESSAENVTLHVYAFADCESRV